MIIDEAHNLAKVCEDVGSVTISESMVMKSRGELAKLEAEMKRKGNGGGGEDGPNCGLADVVLVGRMT